MIWIILLFAWGLFGWFCCGLAWAKLRLIQKEMKEWQELTKTLQQQTADAIGLAQTARDILMNAANQALEEAEFPPGPIQ